MFSANSKISKNNLDFSQFPRKGEKIIGVRENDSKHRGFFSALQ